MFIVKFAMAGALNGTDEVFLDCNYLSNVDELGETEVSPNQFTSIISI